MKTRSLKTTLPAFSALALLAFLAVQEADLSAYVLNGASFPGQTATFWVNPNFTDPSAGTAQQQVDAVRAAADQWRFSGQADFQFLYQGTTGVATVAADGVNTVFYANEDGNGALAVTWWWISGGSTTNFDIKYFDRDGAFDFIWATSPSSSQFDIQGVGTHEFGHALGLGHSSISAATMFPSVAAGSTATRSLDADDVAGIQAIYGPAPALAPTVTGVSPNRWWVDGSTFVTVTGTDFPPSGAGVTFDGVPASIVQVFDANTLTCLLPAGSAQGPVDVAVTNGSLSGSLTGGFTYDTCRAPAGTNLTPGWNTIEGKVPAGATMFYRGLLSTVLQNNPMTVFDPADTRMFPLGWSDLLYYTFYASQYPASWWTNTSGFLDAGGAAAFQVNAPNDPSLSGTQIFTCFYVLDAQSISGVHTISNPLTLVLP